MRLITLSAFSIFVVLIIGTPVSAGWFSDVGAWLKQQYSETTGKVIDSGDVNIKSGSGSIKISASGSLPSQKNEQEQEKIACDSEDNVRCETSKDCYEQGKNYCTSSNILAVQQCNEGFCKVKTSQCSQMQQCTETEKDASCVRKHHPSPKKGSFAHLLYGYRSDDKSTIKKGVIVAPEKLKESAEYISKLKGWSVLLIPTVDDTGKELSPEVVGKETRKKIVNEYRKNKFIYLLILGDEKGIPIQSKALLDNCRKDTRYGSNAPVLDSYYFGDITGDNAPDLAVGRLPFNDLSSIIKYFDIKQDYSQNPLVSMVVFPDDTPVIDFNDLSELKKTLLFSSYEYEMDPEVIQEDDTGVIHVYKNPSWSKFNDIISTSDWITVKAHGTPTDFSNSADDTCGGITLKDGSHPIIQADSCKTSVKLGKNVMAQGALAYIGHYVSPLGAGQFSIFDIGKDLGIGDALRDSFVLEGGDYSYILYGDPSLNFPVHEPKIKSEGNNLRFSKIKENFILSDEGISDLEGCLAKNKDNKFYMGCWDKKNNYFRIGKTSDNSLLIQNSWFGSLRAAGKYGGATFEKITSVNFIANNKARKIRIDSKNQETIIISFDEYTKRFLYENGALENGFTIEFETEK